MNWRFCNQHVRLFALAKPRPLLQLMPSSLLTGGRSYPQQHALLRALLHALFFGLQLGREAFAQS